MLVKTKGIVIKQTKYSDSGVIVKIFTEEMGIQSFFVRGLRSKKSKTKAVLFQPLTILDLVFNFSDKKSLHNIVDVELGYAYQSISINMIKRSLLFFIDELLHKCLKEETENKELFNWMENALMWLDLEENNFVNFHLIFMIQLSMFMGFYPKNESRNEDIVFDLQEGKYCENVPFHQHWVKGELAILIRRIQASKFEDSSAIQMNNATRKKVLETMIAYFNLHVPSLGEFKSLEVLKVVLE